jgi:anti-sigma regulatory factor (Ser/Thr protein kinase)
MSVRRTAAADGAWPGPAEARRPPGRRTGLSLVPGLPADAAQGPTQAGPEAGRAREPGRAGPQAGDTALPRPWARASSLSLAPLDTAPGCARGHARLVLREWGAAGLANDAALAVSELVTNAVRASWRRGTPVRLQLLHDPGQLVIEVWDQHPAPPCPAPAHGVPAGEAESGRGLAVVAALARRWGHYDTDGGWKVVWCELSESGRATEAPAAARTEQNDRHDEGRADA